MVEKIDAPGWELWKSAHILSVHGPVLSLSWFVVDHWLFDQCCVNQSAAMFLAKRRIHTLQISRPHKNANKSIPPKAMWVDLQVLYLLWLSILSMFKDRLHEQNSVSPGSSLQS